MMLSAGSTPTRTMLIALATLWSCGTVTAAQLGSATGHTPHAAAMLLRRMEARGAATRHAAGPGSAYSAAWPPEALSYD